MGEKETAADSGAKLADPREVGESNQVATTGGIAGTTGDSPGDEPPGSGASPASMHSNPAYQTPGMAGEMPAI
ncbi:MAG: hypothetical protein ABI782_03120 [Anaerolineaceae bacterium]